MEMPTEIYHSNLSANQYASNNEFLTDFNSNRQTESARTNLRNLFVFIPLHALHCKSFFGKL